MRYEDDKPFYKKPVPLFLYTFFILFSVWAIYAFISNSYVSISLRAASFYNSELGNEIVILEKEKGDLNNILADQKKLQEELENKVREYSVKIHKIKSRDALIGDTKLPCTEYIPNLVNCTNNIFKLDEQYLALSQKAQRYGLNIIPAAAMVQRDRKSVV